MNRRKKKPQQVDYVQLMKDKFAEFDWAKIKDDTLSQWARLPKLHQRGLMVLTPLVLILLVVPFPQSADEPQPESSQRVAIDINTQSLSEQGEVQSPETLSDEWKEYTVKNGDTLAQVFRSNGLPMSDLNALVKVEGSDKPLSRIKAGQLVRFKLAQDGSLDILQLEKSAQSVMFFRVSDGGFGRSK
ncbi:LysM-like peptidoglycan-binding domain-containing protein [Vibrio scophthalmi]|uniref:Cell envelope opacity-associated protein A n=1 Tax=Vibrio scophthalmi LMG 19158 TaxID=870967 RepID=F9RR57_9VIBR|nr:LysM-like peptidoglycan-binding domain-containing protein [Vibrio scophthalmi]EGU33406.1 cell envelope opacity-associated protein A [Vibrio scophthalmi LMG 19158]